MKYLFLGLKISLIALYSISAFAESSPTFKNNKFYLAEGRWFSSPNGYLFKVNEGNANEEAIFFATNQLALGDKVKYKLCFKIKKDCSVNCKAEVIKDINMLPPWREIQPLVPDNKGSYISVSESTCTDVK